MQSGQLQFRKSKEKFPSRINNASRLRQRGNQTWQENCSWKTVVDCLPGIACIFIMTTMIIIITSQQGNTETSPSTGGTGGGHILVIVTFMLLFCRIH